MKKFIAPLVFGIGSLLFIFAASITSATAAVPVWVSSDSANFAEGQSIGTDIITLDAGDSLTAYAIVSVGSNGNSVDHAKFQITGDKLEFNFVPNFDTPTDANGDGEYVVVVKATSGGIGGGQTSSLIHAITVTNVNVAPVLPADATASSAENTSTSATVYDANATDADSGTTIVYTKSGTDSGDFNINTSTGVVTWDTAPNFEAPADSNGDNVYNIIVTASDGTLSDTQNVEITVSGVDEFNTVITNVTNFADFNENASGIVYTATATDADSGTSIVYSISDADSAYFAIDSSTGVVTFLSPPDFENPGVAGDNDYVFFVTAVAGTLVDTGSVTIYVKDVNETPTVTGDLSKGVEENETTTGYTATSTDPDTLTVITYSISGDDATLFDIDSSTGVVTFITAPDFETPSDLDGNNVYTFEVTATDEEGLAHTDTVTVTVSGVDETATVIDTTVTSGTFDENASGTVYTATATDADSGTAIVYSITGGEDAEFFDIDSSTGVVTFKNSPDFEDPLDVNVGDNIYTFVVTAVAGTLADTQTVDITVTNVNETPTVTSGAAVNYAENGTGTAYTATATDPDTATTITYSISSALADDAALFNIDPSTGVVTFITPPDFENPSDLGGNNVYNISVIATDGDGLSDTQTVNIDVTNVNEVEPTITSETSTTFAENGTGTAYTANSSVTVEVGTTIVYSISGDDDAHLFEIDSSTGIVTFIAAPDFETPLDSDGDNDYVFVVTATAGPMADTETVTITVTNVNEAPVIISGETSTVTENVSAYNEVVYYAGANDPDIATTIEYSIYGPDSGLFVIDSVTGEVRFAFDVSFESPQDTGETNGDNVYEFTVDVWDGVGLYDTQTVTIEVTQVDEKPTAFYCSGTPGGFVCDWTGFTEDPNFGYISGNDFTYEVDVLIEETWTSTGITIASNKVFGGLLGDTEYQICVAHYAYGVTQEYACVTETTAALPTGTPGPGGSGGPGSAGDSAQTTLVLIVKTSLPVGETASSQIVGGSGTGAITYTSADTTICTISSTGVVTGVKIGDCMVYATKAASTGFAAAISNPVTVKVTKSLADVEAENKAAAAKAKADADAVAAKAKADADAAAAKAKADADAAKAKAKTPTVKKPKVYFAISFAFGSSEISAAELKRIKALAKKLGGFDIKVSGFRSQTKPGLDTKLATNRANSAVALLKKLAPTANYTVTSSYSAISSVCNKLVPKANNQCVVIYRTN